MVIVSKIIKEVLIRLERSKKPIICNVSNRHVHLSQEDVEKLFGSGYKLKKVRALVQPGEYAAREAVDLLGPKNILRKVRVLGPVRKNSQVEVSRTDCYVLGINAPLRNSGDIAGTPGVRLIGTYGSVEILRGLIIARRHIHMTEDDSLFFKVKEGQMMRIRINSPRPAVFEDVMIRVSNKYRLECHIDIDEANACDLRSGTEIFLS